MHLPRDVAQAILCSMNSRLRRWISLLNTWLCGTPSIRKASNGASKPEQSVPTRTACFGNWQPACARRL